MIDNDKTCLFLSSSIAAALAASRLSIFSLKKTIIFAFAILNLDIVFGILAVLYGHKAITIAAIVIAVLTLLWSAFQMNRVFRIERNLHAALLLWSKELGDLSGDLVDVKEAGDDKEKINQRIRVIQSFLELLTSIDRPS
jgi:hypothetical protein